MEGKIVFEEHFALEETIAQSRSFAGESPRWKEFQSQMLETGSMPQRISRMDQNGIEFAIVSFGAPGVQAILDTSEAIALARKANDTLAESVAKRPDRLGAFAALPMQDPEAAAEELTRCVKMGFKGALVNGFTNKDVPESAIYYDAPEYRDFWATVEKLDVLFYMHPRMQIPSQSHNYEGHPWLKSAPWGFAVETSIHAWRLCGSGLFDQFPNLRIGLGHLGEMIPFGIGRTDARMRFSPRGYRGKRPLGDYFRQHFHVTTSGNFNDPAFRCTVDALNRDQVYFCADYPYESMKEAADWFDNTPVLNEADRLKIGRENAIRLFKLDHLKK